MTPTMAAGSAHVERLTQQQDQTFQRAKMMLDAATREGRAFTPEEEMRYPELMDQHTAFDKRIEQAQSDNTLRQPVEQLTGGAGRPGVRGTSIGAQFAAHIADFIMDGKH